MHVIAGCAHKPEVRCGLVHWWYLWMCLKCACSILLIDPALILSQGSVDNVLNEKWLMNAKCNALVWVCMCCDWTRFPTQMMSNVQQRVVFFCGRHFQIDMLSANREWFVSGDYAEKIDFIRPQCQRCKSRMRFIYKHFDWSRVPFLLMSHWSTVIMIERNLVCEDCHVMWAKALETAKTKIMFTSLNCRRPN